MTTQMVRLAAVVLALTSAAAPACAAEEAGITGLYDCRGDNGDGTQYQGVVRISKTQETYEIQWTVAGISYVGVGIIDNGRLCSSWAATINGVLIKGVVVYQIQPGKLVGRWAQYPGSGKIMGETLVLRQ